MSRHLDLLLTDLRAQIAALGADGGLISASVYDTAQVARLAPPAEGVWPALEWLLSQQHADGGWGSPAAPRTRDLPTLAAMLALDTHGTRRSSGEAVRRGQAFLARQTVHWHGPLAADLTAGLELLLPRLLDQAAERGLAVSPAPYSTLIALGARRRALIARLRPGLGTTALHSWEAWGEDPDPALLDQYGSVGNSLAATAYWLYRASYRAELAAPRDTARGFLAAGARATGLGIPGVVPTCWPIPRFEQVFGLHTLYLGSLLNHPSLADIVGPQIAQIERAFTPEGIGHSDSFAPDGDDTAAALAVLYEAGRPVNMEVLQRFAEGDHFCAWPQELQPSVSVTAHAIQTLRLLGIETTPYESFLIANQGPDGRWPGDKWNSSWLYTTWRALVALKGAAQSAATRRALAAILAHQRNDGGWGTDDSNSDETAYAVLALRSLAGNRAGYDGASEALARGDAWLYRNYKPFADAPITLWLAKESYRPIRIARVLELTALLSSLPEISCQCESKP